MAKPPAALARPWRVGLTGGIASGKTTVAKLFAALGVPVIDADEVAREIVEPGTPVLARIVARFGLEALGADGRLDRRALRSRVFADPALRRELEALTHPAIREAMERRAELAGGRYHLFVIPLLAEKGRDPRIDRVLVVDCAEALQRRRLQARDGSSAAEVEAILAAQAPRAARLAVADDVIRNDGDLEALRDAVESLHRDYVLRATGVYGAARAPAQ